MISWRRALYLAGIGIGGLLFAYQVWNGYQGVVHSALHISHPVLIAVAWGLVEVSFALQMIAWSWLMDSLGSHLSWRQVVEGYTLSFLARYIPGSIWGYVSRGEWLRQDHNVAYSVSHFGSILEILTILTALGLISGIYLASVFVGLYRLILLVLTIIFLPSVWLILSFVPRWVLSTKLLNKSFGNVASLHLSIGTWVAVVMFHLLLWLCYGSLVLFITEAFGIRSEGGLVQYTFLFGLAWVVGFLAVFIPAGLGVREIALSSLLVTSVGLSASQASAVSVMSRLMVACSELLWVGIGIVATRMPKPDGSER